MPPLLGASARELCRMPTIAMLASDWPTAAQAARERLERHPDDEGALVALTVALWEQGHEEEARRLADVNGTPQSNARIRASVRFHHHIDDLPGAQAALDRLADPPVAVSLGIARGWRRGSNPAAVRFRCCSNRNLATRSHWAGARCWRRCWETRIRR